MTSENFTDRRWIDDKYNGTRYPKYATGAAGYVISRAVAEYIANSFSELEDYRDVEENLRFFEGNVIFRSSSHD